MEAINYTSARADLARIMDQVNDDRRTMLITRQRGRPVVMMALDDYNSLEETGHLLRNPANAERLLGAIEQLRSGGDASCRSSMPIKWADRAGED